MKILVVGDSYMPTSVFSAALDRLGARYEVTYLQVDETRRFVPETDSERAIDEFIGTPDQVIEALDEADVLVVHGAPVTDEVLAAAPRLRLVCCARGGPVNVDVAAASRRRLPVVTTPGKNAEAVAELTLAFIVMLARGISRAQTFLQAGGTLKSTFDGKEFFGSNVSEKALGLVGFGRVGREVAVRARALRMRAIAFDPNVDDAAIVREKVEPVDLIELLEQSDFVSLHARATPDNENLFGPAEFAAMKPGSFFVNTARETLVDESALAEALSSGWLKGAALDVVRPYPQGTRHPLLAFENVVITPHIGGATGETLALGARMLADEIRRFAANEPLRWLINGYALQGS
jgi:D-3-phosphoglycerate dehydrogenase